MWEIPWSHLQCWHLLAWDSLQCFPGYQSSLRCSKECGFTWNCTRKWSAFQSSSTEPGKQNKDTGLIAFPAFRKMFLSGTQACHSVASGESQIRNNLSFPLNRKEFFNLHSVIFLFLSTSGFYSSTYNNFSHWPQRTTSTVLFLLWFLLLDANLSSAHPWSIISYKGEKLKIQRVIS